MSGETIISSPAKLKKIRDLKENSPIRSFLDDDSLQTKPRIKNQDLDEFLLHPQPITGNPAPPAKSRNEPDIQESIMFEDHLMSGTFQSQMNEKQFTNLMNGMNKWKVNEVHGLIQEEQ